MDFAKCENLLGYTNVDWRRMFLWNSIWNLCWRLTICLLFRSKLHILLIVLTLCFFLHLYSFVYFLVCRVGRRLWKQWIWLLDQISFLYLTCFQHLADRNTLLWPSRAVRPFPLIIVAWIVWSRILQLIFLSIWKMFLSSFLLHCIHYLPFTLFLLLYPFLSCICWILFIWSWNVYVFAAGSMF